jgi:photosystem II stability/assembly factor-like uncharacterized protein
MTRRTGATYLFAVLFSTAGPADGAQALHAQQIRQNLFSACIATERVGWVVGELGRILRTEDGGETWTRQDANVKKPFLTISCIDASTAWIGGKSGILSRTTDGGATWQPQTSNTTKHIFDMTFLTRTHGVAVGDWGLLMFTEDGGEHWTIGGIPEEFILSPMAEDIGLEPSDIILYALAFPDDTHGWTVGEFGTIMTTTDGGRTWRQQHVPVESTLFGTYFEDSQRGWAVGIDAVILQTTNGGLTWRQVQAPLSKRAFYDIALTGPYGWIAGDAGTLLKTVNRGRTWEVEPLPIDLAVNWFRAVRLLPSGRGLVVGGDGLLFSIDKDTAHDLRNRQPHIAARRGPS